MTLPALDSPRNPWGPMKSTGSISTIDTATVKLGLTNIEKETEEGLCKLREAGHRYRSLAEALIVRSVLKTNELIPVMMVGKLQEVKDDYFADNPKISHEWWISWLFMRAITISDDEFAELCAQGYHGMDQIMRRAPEFQMAHGPQLAMTLNVGASVQAEYPGITVREFTPNDDYVDSSWVNFGYNPHTRLRNRLAIHFCPLMFLQDRDPRDVICAVRWPSLDSKPTLLNWYIRLAAQLWSGRDDPDVAPVSTYMDTYIPPYATEPIGETIAIYSGDDFIAAGKEEARQNGACLSAPEAAFA